MSQPTMILDYQGIIICDDTIADKLSGYNLRVSEVCKGIVEITQQTSLIHTNNHICLMTFKNMLASNMLIHINLSCNSIKNKGAIQIADTLQTISQIECVDLAYNFISDEGVQYLANLLVTNPNIKIINVTGNYGANIKNCKQISNNLNIPYNDLVAKLHIDDFDLNDYESKPNSVYIDDNTEY